MLQPLTNQPLIGTLLALLCVALISDYRARRIPNRIIAYGLIIGVVGNAWVYGWSGTLFAIGGAAAGLLCLLPFYLTGAMGAGDAKLTAMCGAFLGPIVVVVAAVVSLVVGGMIGVALYLRHYMLTPAAAAEPHTDHVRTVPSRSAIGAITIPYAFAIVVGVLTALAMLPEISAFLEGTT